MCPMTASVSLSLILLALAAPSAQVVRRTPLQGVDLQRVEWVGEVEAGDWLRVDNGFGDVRLRFGGEKGKVEVQAMIQQLQAAPGSLDLTASKLDEGSVALTVVERATGADQDGPASTARSGRVDLVILVPRGTQVSVRTVYGAIEARDLTGRLDLSSDSGSVELMSVHGPVMARSSRGEIRTYLAAGADAGPQKLETVTGDIRAFIPEGADLAVSAATSGELCTDFSIQIEHRRQEEPDKRATLTLGEGRQDLQITSKRGRICLLRSPGAVAPQAP